MERISASKRAFSVSVSNIHTHSLDISPSITTETIYLYDWCALWIMEPIWSESLRRFGRLMEVTGFLPWEQRRESTAVIKESPEGVICILRSQRGGNDLCLLLSAPSQFISDMLLIFYTAIMENWTFMALSNFPRLWNVRIIWPFHGVKMTELSIILLWLQGKPQMLWKCCFIKSYLASFLSLSGVHKIFPHNYKTTSDKWIM